MLQVTQVPAEASTRAYAQPMIMRSQDEKYLILFRDDSIEFALPRLQEPDGEAPSYFQTLRVGHLGEVNLRLDQRSYKPLGVRLNGIAKKLADGTSLEQLLQELLTVAQDIAPADG